MLKEIRQIKMSLSPYQDLYEIIVPQEHILRRIKENIDFSFVNPMLKKQYSERFGRPAKEPEMMFKLLFLKKLYDLSDERLVSAAQTDMAYKYFLDMEPEDKMVDSSLLTKFRKTRITEDILEEILKETIKQAVDKGLIKSGINNCDDKIKNLYQRISELLETDRIKEIRSKDDEDAKFGHKTATSTFFGYKNHIAMTDNRIITAVEVTDGAQPDGKQLEALVDKSKENGIEVSEVVGDMAYVSDENLAVCEENDIILYAKTNTAVVAATKVNLDKGFWFNKDAGLLQCPSGELATRAEKRKAGNGNTYFNYCFSKKKCNKCPYKDTCRVGKSKSHTYSITRVAEKNRLRLEFESSDIFQEKMKVRHRIEEKNGEMKIAHGFDRADSVGLVAMRLQAYFTAFVVNVKRITALSTVNAG